MVKIVLHDDTGKFIAAVIIGMIGTFIGFGMFIGYLIAIWQLK